MRRFFFIAVAIFLLLVPGAVSAQSRISVDSYKIIGITPVTFTSINGEVQFTCSSKSRSNIFLSNISGTIYKLGKPLVKGSAAPFSIRPGKSTFVVSGNASLCSGVSLVDVLSSVSFNVNDYSADVNVIVKEGGKMIPISMKNVPLSQIIRR